MRQNLPLAWWPRMTPTLWILVGIGLIALAVPAAVFAQPISGTLTLVPGPTATWLVTPAGLGQRPAVFDGYLEVELLDQNGIPIVNFPFQDIWLESCSASTFNSCSGGLSADTNTNALGQTTIGLGGFVAAGGWTLDVQLLVSGVPMAGTCIPLRINSPDLSGDLTVDLVDISLFAQDVRTAIVAGGPIAFRSDFYPDGILSLIDTAIMMRHLNEVCP